MAQKILYLIIAIFVGFIFYTFNVPAGWLVGAIFTGVLFGVFVKRLDFDGWPFRIALAFVGANISLMLRADVLKQVHHLLLPLLITIIIMMTSGFLLGNLLHKKSKRIDKVTAFFCCIPGGASEIIGLSGEYGADNRFVAAFHTVRITVFSLAIPFIVGYLNPSMGDTVIKTSAMILNGYQILFFTTVIILTLLLEKIYHIPGGTLIFSIAFGFLLSEFVIDVSDVPRYISGIGQASIGAFVGIRFDRKVLNEIVKIGPITLAIVGTFFLLSVMSSVIFMFLTELSFSTSLLGTVPAGAAEMSVTAVALNINPTTIASLHIIRVICTFLALPILMKVFTVLHKDTDFIQEKSS